MKKIASVKSLIIIDEGMCERINKKKIVFKPGPNVLIGPNGSGKSSIIEILTSDKHKDLAKIDLVAGDYLFFDFEKHNPRKSNYYQGPLDVLLRFKSHGESNKAILEMLTSEKAEGKMVFLDEPEQALDIDGLSELLQQIKKSKTAQIIIVTHCPNLILNPMFNVVELEDGYYDKIRNSVTKLVSK